MKGIDISAGAARTAYVKALVYGKPGTGKTTFGVSAPAPLILLSERQAVTHVAHAAARYGRTDVQVLAMETLADYRHVLRALNIGQRNATAKAGPFVVRDDDGAVLYEHATWPETIVLDSLTDACRLVDEEIRRISPPKPGKDGLDVMPERYWQALAERCERLIRSFRDLEYHVLFLALEDDRTTGEGDEVERSVGPALPMRKLPALVAAAVNVVGITVRSIRQQATAEGEERRDADLRFGVRTVGPGYYLLKPYRPLADMEIPDFASWVERINAAIVAGDSAPEAQPPAEKKATRKAQKEEKKP